MAPCCFNNPKSSWVFMEFLFNLDSDDRDACLRTMMHNFGFSYMCLWSYSDRPSNCLQGLAGIYLDDDTSQASSSSGSRASHLFQSYRRSRDIFLHSGVVPGLAFGREDPYIELKLPQLQTLVFSDIQLRFYQEARIKTVVFIGCAMGEIEVGMSTDPQINLRTELEGLFSPVAAPRELDLPQPIDPNLNQQPPSSSSSSLRSLSVDSPEYPSFFNIPTTTSYIGEPSVGETPLEEALRVSNLPPLTVAAPMPPATNPLQQAIRSLMQSRPDFPSIETENAVVTKAMIDVISQITPPNSRTAFRPYRGTPAPATTALATRTRSMFKRAVLYMRNMEIIRRSQASLTQGNPRPTAQSWQHTIQERRRRQKINDSFQILRSLLPPGSKKDKASVLSNTTEYLSTLKSQVAELIKRNKMLESQLPVQKPELVISSSENRVESSSSSGQQRVNVQIGDVASSSSETGRLLDVRVSVRGECSMVDVVIRILEYLKQQRDVNLMSLESNFMMSQQNIPMHAIMIRLRIEGNEFDEAGFEEALKRVVDD